MLAATAQFNQQPELEQTRGIMGRFILFICFVMVSYTFAVQAALQFAPSGATSSLVTFPLTLLWFGAAWLLMRCSGLPLAFFGVTTRGWRSSMRQTLVWTVAGCTGATLLKLGLIETHQLFADEPLFNLSGLSDPATTNAEVQTALMLAAVYAVTAPLQEFVMRAALQMPLHHCLVGRSSRAQSIVLSSALFSVGPRAPVIEFRARRVLRRSPLGWTLRAPAPAGRRLGVPSARRLVCLSRCRVRTLVLSTAVTTPAMTVENVA